MIKQQVVCVYWGNGQLTNLEYLSDLFENGWIVSTSHLLHDKHWPDVIVYVLEKEFMDHGEQND